MRVLLYALLFSVKLCYSESVNFIYLWLNNAASSSDSIASIDYE
jgi:hypothetical protein